MSKRGGLLHGLDTTAHLAHVVKCPHKFPSTSIWYTLPSHLTVIEQVGCGFKNKEKWK